MDGGPSATDLDYSHSDKPAQHYYGAHREPGPVNKSTNCDTRAPLIRRENHTKDPRPFLLFDPAAFYSQHLGASFFFFCSSLGVLSTEWPKFNQINSVGRCSRMRGDPLQGYKAAAGQVYGDPHDGHKSQAPQHHKGRDSRRCS